MADTGPKLKRSIGLPLLLFFGLGNILGAGIYVLIGKVAGEASMFTPIAFFVASIVACFSAFSYSELSSRYPVSAGAAVYIEEGFHFTFLSRLTGILIAFSGMVSAATISRGFYGYFDQFIQLPEPLVVAGIIFLLGALAVWGIKESVSVAALLTLIELGGLLMVIWAGSDALIDAPAQIETLLPPMSSTAWNGILLGAFIAFFAFIGFEDMVNIAEEVKNPKRNMPAAILLALLIATTVYALVSLAAVLTLDQDTLSQSKAPLADIISTSADFDPKTISLIGMLAIINGALIQIIMASRIFYGMANKGWIWHGFTAINPRTKTPVTSTLLVTGIILALALFFPLEALAKGTSFLVLVVFTLVNTALVMIKRRHPAAPDTLDIPMWAPVTGLISSTGLLSAFLLIG